MSITKSLGRVAVATIATLVPVVAAVSAASSASATTTSHPAVTVRAGSVTQTAGCPQTTTFTARVLSNGPAVVRYHWLRNDGATTRTGTLHFRGPGHHSYAVHNAWTLGVDASGWQQLIVTSPDGVSTRRMAFSTYCAPGVYVAYTTATDSSALCGDVYTDLSGQLQFDNVSGGIRYYWTVDGTVVDDTTVTDPTVLASYVLDPSFHYAFIASPGTVSHSAVLHIESIDGGAADSYSTTFTTTCA